MKLDMIYKLPIDTIAEYLDDGDLRRISALDSHMGKKLYDKRLELKWTTYLKGIIGSDIMDIPEQIVTEIKNKIQKKNTKVNITFIKNILKELKYGQYYQYMPHFVRMFTNGESCKYPPALTKENINKITLMLKNIDKSSDKFISNYGLNNNLHRLNLSYVLYKIFQILEMNVYLEYIPISITKGGLAMRETIWEKICCDLGYKFIPFFN